jgi:nicotinate-nucleotide pyrophosphorylase (carboxylating)
MIDELVKAALLEDAAFHDVTTRATVPPDLTARASLRTRADGVIAGVALVQATFAALDPHTVVDVLRPDGSTVRSGDTVAVISGTARALLSGERTALNFIQRLSGVATVTARYVDAVKAPTPAFSTPARRRPDGARSRRRRCGQAAAPITAWISPRPF